MDFIYKDDHIVVCVKPPRVLSTDEPGGLPELVRQALGDEKADVRTVHRLDRVVSGLMVLASRIRPVPTDPGGYLWETIPGCDPRSAPGGCRYAGGFA